MSEPASSCDEELSSIMSNKCNIGKTTNNLSVRSFNASRMIGSRPSIRFQPSSSSFKGASNSQFDNKTSVSFDKSFNLDDRKISSFIGKCSSVFKRTSASLKKGLGKSSASKSFVPVSGSSIEFEFDYPAPMQMSREYVQSLLNSSGSRQLYKRSSENEVSSKRYEKRFAKKSKYNLSDYKTSSSAGDHKGKPVSRSSKSFQKKNANHR